MRVFSIFYHRSMRFLEDLEKTSRPGRSGGRWGCASLVIPSEAKESVTSRNKDERNQC